MNNIFSRKNNTLVFVVIILKSFCNSFVEITSLVFQGSKRAGTQIQTKRFEQTYPEILSFHPSIYSFERSTKVTKYLWEHCLKPETGNWSPLIIKVVCKQAAVITNKEIRRSMFFC